MKKLSRTDKLIRFSTLSLIAGLALPLACSDDNVPDNPGDGGWITDGAGGYGGKGYGGYGGKSIDGGPRVGGCGAGKGGGCARGGTGGAGMGVHLDGRGPDHDAGPEDAGL
jgi:hypothetical protein